MESVLIDLPYFSLVGSIYYQHLISLFEQLHNIILNLFNNYPFKLLI